MKYTIETDYCGIFEAKCDKYPDVAGVGSNPMAALQRLVGKLLDKLEENELEDDEMLDSLHEEDCLCKECR